MERKERNDYPLKNIEYSDLGDSNTPSGIMILPPGERSYTSKPCDKSTFKLIPYLNEIFRDSRKISLEDLYAILDSNQEYLFTTPVKLGDSGVLEQSLRELSTIGIVSLNPVVKRDFSEASILISKGKNYDSARVFA